MVLFLPDVQGVIMLSDKLQVGKAFGVTPAALGTLTFIRSLVQALASPLAAYLVINHNRIVIISIGAAAWGVATAAVGMCTAYWQVRFLLVQKP